MQASKLSAYISGLVVATFATFIEATGLPFVLVAIVFFPAMIIYVVGLEIWREFNLGEHIGLVGPKDSEGWRIYGRASLRMIVMFIGASSVILVSALLSNI